ncbi:PTS glucose/sucrose transporter subunit IIB [Cellulomonas sp.]|nr:PTS glucose/sucrose transporter subunit IIB [Cellulomonas sp.]
MTVAGCGLTWTDLLVDLRQSRPSGRAGAKPERPRRTGRSGLRWTPCADQPAPVDPGSSMSKAEQILAALGGDTNVVDLEPCITRLRVEVTDAHLVDEAALKASGAFGVVRSGRIVQVIVGPEADNLAAELDTLR